MRAYSSKKFREPMVINGRIIMISVDGKVELSILEPIKYINAVTNETKLIDPKARVIAPQLA